MVINIDDEDYKMLVQCGENVIDLGLLLRLRNLVRESKPFPKGHGRLIDADALLKDVKDNSESYFADDFAHEWVDVAPTIIEADEVEE